MKKTGKLLAMGILSVSLLAGCGGQGNDAKETTVNESQGIQAEALSDYSQYVTLGQYKGIQVDAVAVSNEEVEAYIEGAFRNVVQIGDTVNIDYVGTKDGVAFDNGSAQGDSLTIGSGRFIEGFEEGLVGVKVGESVDLDLTFPEGYQAADLAGQAVVFHVTVNGIDGVLADELNEDYVKNNTLYASIDEYKESVREALYEQKETQQMSDIWEIIKANAVILQYPQEELTKYAAEMSEYYAQMAVYYGMDLETLITSSGATMEEFNADCQAYAEQVLTEAMILREIARLEAIIISDEEYREEIDKAIESSGYTEEELLANYGGESEIRESLLYNKVILFITEQAVKG